jgi:hypothetical protein
MFAGNVFPGRPISTQNTRHRLPRLSSTAWPSLAKWLKIAPAVGSKGGSHLEQVLPEEETDQPGQLSQLTNSSTGDELCVPNSRHIRTGEVDTPSPAVPLQFYPRVGWIEMRNFPESFGISTFSSPVSLRTAIRVPCGERMPEGYRRFVTVTLALRTRCIVVIAQQERCKGNSWSRLNMSAVLA